MESSSVSVIEPEDLQYLPAKTLLQLVEKSQQANKNFKTCKQTVTQIPGLFRRLEELDVDLQFNLDNDYIAMLFTGDGKRLGDVWGALRQHGYTTHARPKKGDTTFYSFWELEGQARIFMSFSSSMCRRVQVGTKMVEQPIYETQCGDLPELDAGVSKPNLTVVEGGDSDIPF